MLSHWVIMKIVCLNTIYDPLFMEDKKSVLVSLSFST